MHKWSLSISGIPLTSIIRTIYQQHRKRSNSNYITINTDCHVLGRKLCNLFNKLIVSICIKPVHVGWLSYLWYCLWLVPYKMPSSPSLLPSPCMTQPRYLFHLDTHHILSSAQGMTIDHHDILDRTVVQSESLENSVSRLLKSVKSRLFPARDSFAQHWC